MKTDARVRYTKQVIKDSFISLLEEKELHHITVKSICEKAEINRATFYKYYLDQFDLLDKIEEELLEETQTYIDVNVDINNAQSIYRNLILILNRIKKYGYIYITICSKNADPYFPFKVLSLFYEKTKEEIKKINPDFFETKFKLTYTYVSRGCAGIISEWIASGMTASVEDVADITNNLIKNTMIANSKKDNDSYSVFK